MCWLMTLEKPEETGTVKSLNSIRTNPCPPHIPRRLSFLASALPYPCCVCPPRPNSGCAVCSPVKPGECSRSPIHIIPILPSPMQLVMMLLQPSQNSHLHALSVTIKLESPSSNQQNRNQHRLCEELTYQISELDLKSMKFRSLQEQRQTSTQ